MNEEITDWEIEGETVSLRNKDNEEVEVLYIDDLVEEKLKNLKGD